MRRSAAAMSAMPSSLAPSSPSGRCVAATTMPPSAQMRLHQRRQNCRSESRVEPGRRLVEQPDRAPADQQPGDRRAAPLAGRQIAEGQVRRSPPSPTASSASSTPSAASPQKSLPEGEILRHRQRRSSSHCDGRDSGRPTQRSETSSPPPSSRTAAGSRRQQPGDDAQQRRLARSVRPGDDQRLARRRGESRRRKRPARRRARRSDPRRSAASVLPGRSAPASRCASQQYLPFVGLELFQEILYTRDNHASGRRGNRILRRTSARAALDGRARGSGQRKWPYPHLCA